MLFSSGCAVNNIAAGMRHLEQKNYAAAIAEFDAAAAGKPDPQVYFGYFQAYMAMNDGENALKYLTLGLAKYPNDAWLNLCAGHWYMKNGNDAAKALGYYEKAKKLRFGKPENVMNEKIDKYIDMAKDQMAVDSLENVMENR